jgi:hypothetical protein
MVEEGQAASEVIAIRTLRHIPGSRLKLLRYQELVAERSESAAITVLPIRIPVSGRVFPWMM